MRAPMFPHIYTALAFHSKRENQSSERLHMNNLGLRVFHTSYGVTSLPLGHHFCTSRANHANSLNASKPIYHLALKVAQ